MTWTMFIILPLYGLLSVYVYLETLLYLKNALGARRGRPGAIAGLVIFSILFAAMTALPLLGTFLPMRQPFKYTCMRWGNLWCGLAMFYGGGLLLCHLIRWMFRKWRISRMSRTVCGVIVSLSLLASLGLNVYGYLHANNTRVVEYYVMLDSAKETSHPRTAKLVVAGDLHMSVNSLPGTIGNMVNLVNEQDADAILLVGDYFTSNYDGLKKPEQYIEELTRLRSRYGIFAVFGNHDVEEDLFIGFATTPVKDAIRDPRMIEFLEACHFNILDDEVATLPNGLQLAGREDATKAGDGTRNRMEEEELLGKCDHAQPIIVLEHEPHDYEDLAELGADLVVSGHTHNGQIFPGNLIAQLLTENSFGLKELYGMQTLVTAGVGFFGPPLRIGTNSDISVIYLTY